MPRKKKVDTVEETVEELKKVKKSTATSKATAKPKAKKSTVSKVKDEETTGPVKQLAPKKTKTSSKKTILDDVATTKKEPVKKVKKDKESGIDKKEPVKKVVEGKKASTSAKASSKTNKKSTTKSDVSENEVVKKTTSKSVTKKSDVKDKTSSKSSTKKSTSKSTVKTKASATKKSSTPKKEATTSKTSKVKTKKSKKESSSTSKTPKKASSSKTRKKTAKNEVSPIIDVIEYYDLPYRYNQTLVKVLYQTPEILFIYWDIADEDRLNFINQYGNDFFNNTKPVLIIHNNTMNYSFEIEIDDFANSWYLHTNDANCEYSVELGRRPKYINNEKQIELPNDYLFVTYSNEIESPNDHVLFDKNLTTVYFKDVKTNITTAQDITSLSYIRNMGRIYNLFDLKTDFGRNNLSKFMYLDLVNPSSGNPTSTFK